ncbi:MAG TPA: heme-copper oxidase subunit III [Candidatus Dormibacteraeota bacterium]|nr:heme-copper oxidase subunit III [Candidatus Dormibacteraeota bacterium]
MPTVTTEHDIELIIEDIGSGGGGGRPPERGGHGGGDDERGKAQPSGKPLPRRYYTAITLAIVSILVFFMALSCAFILRRHATDWVPARLPTILWLNTVVLLASSGTLELARRQLANGDERRFRALWMLTTALGFMFVAGQVLSWKELVSQGIFIASSAASSFFYVFTGLHALHLLGGIAALSYVLLRNFSRAKISQPVAAEIAGHYWHFMDGLWVFLLVLLYFGK